MAPWTELFGAGASFMSVGVQIPQLVKTYRSRDTTSLSLPTTVLHAAISACWVVYGFGFLYVTTWPNFLILTVPNACKCVASTVLVFLILKFRRTVVPKK